MKIGENEIGDGKPVYIIAEAGINHNGNLEIAKKMIEAAAKCKANAIKFQSFSPEEVFSKNKNPKMFDLLKKWSLSRKQQEKLKNYSENNKIEFISTPTGNNSLKILKELNVKAIKIASPDLTDHDFIKRAARIHTPLIISTGMSTLSEIFSAVQIILEEKCPFSLLHCNSSYPTPIKDVNLKSIQYFKRIFDVPIGYSDHTLGTEACSIAVAAGATIIEKHFTLDKNMEGPDQKLSADVRELNELVSKTRKIEKFLGHNRTNITKSEQKFRRLMRKSIATKTDVKAGTKLKKSMLTLLRPGTGIPPIMLNNLIGMTTQRKIEKGTILNWDML